MHTQDETSFHRKTNLQKVLLACLVAAALVTALRFFTATDLGYDLTIQIQAAQNLLSGKGLNYYELPVGLPLKFSDGVGSSSFNTQLVTLTHWPCGYSFYAAAILGLGIPLSFVTKIFGAFFTMLGWWGWGRLQCSCLEKNIVTGGKWFLISVFLAFVLPLLTTPAWNGTDISLWAAVPWVLGWLAAGPRVIGYRGGIYYGLAGLVCGFCCIMRYASVVLLVYVGLVILIQSLPNLRLFLKRILVFTAAALPSMALQAYYNYGIAHGHATPGGINGLGGPGVAWARFVEGFSFLPTVNRATCFWLPESVLKLVGGANGLPAVGLILAVLFMAFPLFVSYKARYSSLHEAFHDVRFLAAGLLMAVPVFLLVCTTVGAFPYTSELRYYGPLFPLTLLLIAFLATPSPAETGPQSRLLTACFSTVLTGFIVVALARTCFIIVPGTHGSVARSALMADADFATFSKHGLAYEKLALRRYVVERMMADPNLHLLTNFEAWFYADPDLDRAKILRIHGFAEHAAKGPLHLLIVAVDEGEDERQLYALNFTGNYVKGPRLNQVPSLRRVKTIDDTDHVAGKIKLLECEIIAGEEVRFTY
ncbi:MAG: hypothetical protein WCK77_15545 [Verrucomicrobiota bacterium]